MKKLLFCLLLITALTGCNGSREPEERDYVMVMAIDQNYNTYVSVARPGRDNSATPEEQIIEGKGESIKSSLENINRKSRGQLYFGHTIACIAQKGILKDSKAVDEIITAVRNSGQFSRTILLLTSDNVENVMKAQPDNSTVSEYIKDYTQINKIYKYNINDMIRAVTHNREITPPKIKAEGKSITITK